MTRYGAALQVLQFVSVPKSYGLLTPRRFPPKKKAARLIFPGKRMAAIKILLVDDDETQNIIMRSLLEREGFDITVARNPAEALRLISAERYDVLLSDLHMPGAADGLTVISAMRHLNPNAIAVLLTGFPEMDVAARTILRQADEIMIKRSDLAALVESIKHRIANGTAHSEPKVESVATILEREAPSCIEDWFLEVQLDSKLSSVPLTPEQRCGHLPQVFLDLVARLRAALPIGSKGPQSPFAASHGLTRRRQGYSAAMMVEESRILQVCIFHMLQNNLATIDFSVLLIQVMTIADEVDSQLRQAMECYVEESLLDTLPA
jgi:CheY-like chemotaxis protein